MNQLEMATHDKTMWQLYTDANHAAAKAAGRADAVRAYWTAQGTKNESRYFGWKIEAMQDDADAAQAMATVAFEKLHNHELAYTGWARFWAVPDGHIHRSTHCSTCNNGQSPTQFWLVHEVSGLDEAAAVASQGAYLCTVCFPTAPVHMTNGYELAAAAKKAAQCPGRRDYDAPSRQGYYSGNWATCDTCHAAITTTSTGKLRAHKAK